jgi:hypothetical protein
MLETNAASARADSSKSPLRKTKFLFRDNIRQFADDKLRSLVKEMDEKRRF